MHLKMALHLKIREASQFSFMYMCSMPGQSSDRGVTGNFDEGSLGMRVTQPSSPILCAEVQTLVAVEVGIITGAARVCDCLSLHTWECAGDAGLWLGAHVGHVSVWHIHGGLLPSLALPPRIPGKEAGNSLRVQPLSLQCQRRDYTRD